MTSQMVSLDNLVSFFFGIFGFRGVNISKVKNPGKRHDLQRKCKMKQTTCGWIREIVGV